MKLGKGHLKYSRKTARENPEMIVREYDHLIQQYQDEIKEIKKINSEYEIKINLEDVSKEDIKHLYYYLYDYLDDASKNEIKIPFSFSNKILENKKYVDNLIFYVKRRENLINGIIEEKERFKQKYKNILLKTHMKNMGLNHD